MTHFTLSENLYRFTPTARHYVHASIVISTLLLLSLFRMPMAEAKDLSLQYRNYPGFTCHHWNSKGECTDFSYYDGPSPSYGGSYNNSYNNSNNSINRDCYDSRGRYDVRYCDDYNSTNYRSSVIRTDDCYDSRGRYDVRYCDDYRTSSSNNNRDCYDSYGRYDTRYCDNSRNRAATVRVSAAPNPVYEDDLLTYTIYLRNDTSSNRTIDVWAFIDPDTFFHSANNGGRVDRSDEVRWSRLAIPARSSKTISLTVRVDRNARDGDKLLMRVEADGDEDEVQTTVRTGNNNSRNCYDSRGRYDSRYCDDEYDDDRDCYDSYGRYNARLCRDDDDDNDEELDVRVYGSPTEAREGELVTYTITLDNDDNSGQTVDVTGFLDPDMDYYSSSDGGDDNGDEVEWDNIYIGPDSSRTLSVSVRIDDDARAGDQLYFRAEADGEEDEVTTRVR